MLRNILLVSFRNIFRYKGYSIINILGLSVGIACAFLVFIYLKFEMSYDKCFEDYENIYRVRSDRHFGPTIDISALSSAMVAPTLKSDYPQVEYATRINKGRPTPVLYEDRSYYVQNNCKADLDFFEVFGIEAILGNTAGFLNPNTVVITENIVNQFFGDKNPIGKVFTVDTINYQVIAVIENWPNNSHIQFDMIFSWEPYELWDFVIENPWEGIAYSYIKLHPEADPVLLDEQIRDLYDRYVNPDVRNENRFMEHHLQPLTDIHLNNNHRNDLGAKGNKSYLYLFAAVGLLVLIIACINYMNLSTARYQTRSREISIRKTVGADRGVLMLQFFSESLIFAFIAHIIALFLVELILPGINVLLELQMTINYSDPDIILGLIVMILFTGIISGSYPALFLSGFQPISVMRGVIKTGNMSVWIRRILVVFQFTVSIALVIGVLTIFSQLVFMKNYSLGFDKENKLVIRFPRNSVHQENYLVVKNEFLDLPGINMATFSSTVPGQWNYVWRTYLPENEEENILMNWYAVDEDFVEVMGLEIIAGRDFDLEYGSDKPGIGRYVINETAVKTFGWESPEDALDKAIWRDHRAVMGVVRDFHLKGLQDNIGPMGMFFIPDDHKYLIMDIAPSDIPGLVDKVESKFAEIFPDAPFLYFFLDSDFDKQYKTEARLSNLFTGLTFLGLFIACLGLLGLASFMAQQRTKEIGIRKVNGAGIKNIIALLIRDFSRWVLIANLIAWPLAFFLLAKWLDTFAYHVKQNILIYIAAGVFAYLLAVVTISFQAVKAARANPVDSLKYE